MRAVQLAGWRQPPQIREVPDPAPGPGEVLIEIGGAGLCHSDLNMLYELEPGILPFDPPFTLGHENAGWVKALGAGVSGLEIGAPVAVYGPWGCGRCYRCQQGAENFCERQAELRTAGGGFGRDGGMADSMVVPSPRHLVPLTDLDPADAAPLADAGLTPYHAIKRWSHLLVPGSHAVVIGAGGGLGHLAVQILRALSPARVIAVDQRDAGVALAKELGADEGVLSGQQASEELRELTSGRGAELVLDFVGVDATLALATSIARSLGHIALVGAGGGSISYGFFTLPYEVSVSTTYWGSLPELVEVMALAERGMIRSRVQRFPLDDAASRLRRCWRPARSKVEPCSCRCASDDGPMTGESSARLAPAAALVIFGASGDLTRRKLLPAIRRLARQSRLVEGLAVVGVGRTDLGDDGFRDLIVESVKGSIAPEHVLSNRYVAGAYDDPGTYRRLGELLAELDATRGTSGNRLYYLATPSSAFPDVVRGLAGAGLHRPPGDGYARIVIEKPYGHDLASAKDLDAVVHEAFAEVDVFRIDHYLAKETVQNLLALRFANSIFQPIWDRTWVDHVQITVAETLGVGSRGGFYEQAGAMRDIVQNHVLQVLALALMEPPSRSTWRPSATRR